MSFALIERLRRSLAVRLAAWHAATFVLGTALLFAFSYVLLASSIQNRERQNIRLQIDLYRAEYEKNRSVDDLVRLIADEKEGEENTYFVRFAAPDNRTVFSRTPPPWGDDPVARLETRRPADGWTILDLAADEVEVATVRLRDGSVLQVGAGTKSRRETLALFQKVFWFTAIPVVVLGGAGGVLVARQGVQPLRRLADTVRDIIATADVSRRVRRGGATDEVGKLVEEFNEMLDRIETLIRGMRESLDNVAHDLRTPLTRLRGIAELALASGGEADRREALATCVEEAEQIQVMLRTLMDISEAETGTMALALEPVGLRDVVREVVELYEFVAEEKAIGVTHDVPEPVTLVADRARLKQIFANLLDNALKYTPAGGSVRIGAAETDARVVVTVADSGPGIAMEERDKIWERLYRADKSRSRRGLGLGLSLVKAVVEAHGGEVAVDGGPGGGASFSVTFPKGRQGAFPKCNDPEITS